MIATILARFPPFDVLSDVDAQMYKRMYAKVRNTKTPLKYYALDAMKSESQDSFINAHKRINEAVLAVFRAMV